MTVDMLQGITAADLNLVSHHAPLHQQDMNKHWSRSSVIYQIYPRSFRDSTGDGIGDLNGITSELHKLKELTIDAVWLSPFYNSPQKDGGYDVSDYCSVDPIFGNLDDFDALVRRAKDLDIRVIVDLVPNHCSTEHDLFKKAVASAPNSPERDMFIFRDGRGDNGSEPPNNWQSHFGGSAWTRLYDENNVAGQWYLHLFDSSQPDWNWDSNAVRAEFERILRFWLDRGVSGFRVDVAHALVKAQGLPDWGGNANGSSSDGFPGKDAPMFGQDAIHTIFRSWHAILDSYDGDRILCAEANVDPLPRLSDWVRKDEMHQAFNFAYLHSKWNSHELRSTISASLQVFDAVDAPTTWVLSNHDVVRHATRYGLSEWDSKGGDGIGPMDVQPDSWTGLARARAATLTMLGLPGGVYLYQGEELGLPDNTMIEPWVRQDPTFARTGGNRLGRDGCRVPIPWEENAPAFGFNETGASWLPQPSGWKDLSRDVQETKTNSTLNMYKSALDYRKNSEIGSGSLTWMTELFDDSVVAFLNGNVLVIMNMGWNDILLPTLPLILGSSEIAGQNGILEPNQTVWLRYPPN